jgi:hypothetical protein
MERNVTFVHAVITIPFVFGYWVSHDLRRIVMFDRSEIYATQIVHVCAEDKQSCKQQPCTK